MGENQGGGGTWDVACEEGVLFDLEGRGSSLWRGFGGGRNEGRVTSTHTPKVKYTQRLIFLLLKVYIVEAYLQPLHNYASQGGKPAQREVSWAR